MSKEDAFRIAVIALLAWIAVNVQKIKVEIDRSAVAGAIYEVGKDVSAIRRKLIPAQDGYYDPCVFDGRSKECLDKALNQRGLKPSP